MQNNYNNKKNIYRTMIPISLIFSDWILFQVFLYFVSIYTRKYNTISNWIYQNSNPYIALIFGFLFNLCLFSYVLYNNYSSRLFLLLALLLLVEKIIPSYWTSFYPIYFYKNMLSFIILFLIYIFYLYTQNTNVYKVYIEIANSIIENKNKTPFFHMMEKIISKI